MVNSIYKQWICPKCGPVNSAYFGQCLKCGSVLNPIVESEAINADDKKTDDIMARLGWQRIPLTPAPAAEWEKELRETILRFCPAEILHVCGGSKDKEQYREGLKDGSRQAIESYREICVPKIIKAIRTITPDTGLRELAQELFNELEKTHHPFSHDYVKDENKCSMCKFLKRAKSALERMER